MCQSVTAFHTCKCAGATCVQKCAHPTPQCELLLQFPSHVDLGVPCSKHVSKLARKESVRAGKPRSTYYPPSSFPKTFTPQSSDLPRTPSSRRANRHTVPPRTPTSSASTASPKRSMSESSSVYSDASVPRSARSRAASYSRTLEIDTLTLSLEQAESLASAQRSLRKSMEKERQRRASEASIFDAQIAPLLEAGKTVQTPTEGLSPTESKRRASVQGIQARIRASLDRERHLIELQRPASARIEKQPRFERANRLGASLRDVRSGRSLHDRSGRRISLDGGEVGMDLKELSDAEKYELFLQKHRRKTAAARQRRAEKKAGLTPGLRERSDGICSLM